MSLCICGCGNPTNIYRGKPRQFIHGHHWRGRKRIDQTGDKHYCWKGDDVSNHCLHEWVRNHLPEPKLCQICNKVPPFDLACVTGIYNRDFKNWQYICRKCHVESDGRIKYLELGRLPMR